MEVSEEQFVSKHFKFKTCKAWRGLYSREKRRYIQGVVKECNRWDPKRIIARMTSPDYAWHGDHFHPGSDVFLYWYTKGQSYETLPASATSWKAKKLEILTCYEWAKKLYNEANARGVEIRLDLTFADTETPTVYWVPKSEASELVKHKPTKKTEAITKWLRLQYPHDTFEVSQTKNFPDIFYIRFDNFK